MTSVSSIVRKGQLWPQISGGRSNPMPTAAHSKKAVTTAAPLTKQPQQHTNYQSTTAYPPRYAAQNTAN